MTSMPNIPNSRRTRLSLTIILLFAIHLLLSSCSSHVPLPPSSGGKPATKATQKPYVINGKRYYPIPSSQGFTETGNASWYGKDFHGRKTSNGETYNMYAKTAAHKTLPMNTMLLVKNLDNRKETIVRVNDRGPFVRGRIIDLSYTAAKEIDMVRQGVARVYIMALGEAKYDKQGREVIVKQNFDKGVFYVQLGAFLNESNAIRLKNKFTATGHKVVIRKLPSSKGTFHRVQLYVGTSLHQAKQAVSELRTLGYKDAFVFAK